MCYSTELKDRIFGKACEYLSCAKNIGKNIVKNISKNLSSNRSQNFFSTFSFFVLSAKKDESL